MSKRLKNKQKNSYLETPISLPQGIKEFDTWAKSIIEAYKLPDNDSVLFMLATMILHAKETDAFLSREYFGLRARKSAANQVAAGIMQELKVKQAKQIEDEKKALEESK